MREISISKNISDLRKKKGITQEQLADGLHISPQAVSKWETGTSFPDTQTLPLIADYFGVSIDYLFYGQDISCDDIYDKVFKKVFTHEQMSKASYEDAHTLFGYAHHGISKGNLRGRGQMLRIYEEPSHITNENGVSLLSGKGYGAILTRAFFESVNKETAEFAAGMLPALSTKEAFLVCMAIVSVNDISFDELKEKSGLDDDTLREVLDKLIEAHIVFEKTSKHKVLGNTYEIADMYHTCLCVLIATVEMQRYSLNGISCCMSFGDYPISF